MAFLPYFDLIINQLEKNNSVVSQAFGRNVHWGYWPRPTDAVPTVDEFSEASDRLTQIFIDLSNIKTGQKFLDVGCGFGGTIGFLNDRFSSVDFTGLNIDSRQVERANQLVAPLAKSGNKINFITGDACDLPFASQTFDTLFAVECIFHFPSRGKFLKEAFRVLKPGGRLVISDFVISNPLMAAVHYVKHRKDLQSFYGQTQMPLLLWRYKLKARLAGLKVETVRDITQGTVPTYAFLHSIAKEMGTEHKDSIVSANRYLQTTAKNGWIRYDVISFRK